MASSIWEARQQVVFTPHPRNLRIVCTLGWFCAITGNQEERLTVRTWHHGMDAMITASFHRAKHFNLVQLVVSITITDAIQARRNLSFVVVDAYIESAERPNHTVHRSDVHIQWFHVSLRQCLAVPRWRNFVEFAKLITDDQPTFIVSTKVDPGTMHFTWNRIKQLDFETLCRLDSVDRCGCIPRLNADSVDRRFPTFGVQLLELNVLKLDFHGSTSM